MEQYPLTFDQLFQAMSTLNCKLDRVERLLSHPSHSTEPIEDRLFTIQDAAKFLTLAVPTLYSLTQRREIPHSKKGKRLYFSKIELEEWIKGGRKKTHSEISEEAKNASGRRVR